jgi:hypothetical protein
LVCWGSPPAPNRKEIDDGSDGSRVTVYVDKSFDVVSVQNSP